MIKKIILFGDFASKDFDDFWRRDFMFMKTAALLRLSYSLRKDGFTVKQIHHCTSFNKDELDHIVSTFSDGDPVLIGISSSFMSSVNRIDYRFHADSREDDINDIGDFWGKKAFKFFMNIGSVAKKYNHPVIMGGFDIQPWKFTNPEDSRAWGFDLLNLFVSYYVMGNNHSIITKFCHNEPLEFETIKGKFKSAKIVTAGQITDFSDSGFTVLPEDNISQGECLITEIAAGCVFSCSFCTYANLGKKETEFCRTYDSLKNEIVSNYENFGVRTYQLADNMINDWPEKLKYLIRIRDETGIDVRWASYARLDTIKTKQQAQMFKDAGCLGIIFGIESMKKEVGPYFGKMTDRNRLIESLHMFRDAVGDTAMTSGSFIAGAPTETKEELHQTYEWLISPEGRHLLDHFIFTPLFIVPNINEYTEINKARQNPFRDYKLSEGINFERGLGWVSPWGTYEEFLDLAIEYSKWNNRSVTDEEAMESLRGVFAIPLMNNLLEGKGEQYISSIRKGEKIHFTLRDEMKIKNVQSIENYKKSFLGNYYGYYNSAESDNPLLLIKEIMKK